MSEASVCSGGGEWGEKPFVFWRRERSKTIVWKLGFSGFRISLDGMLLRCVKFYVYGYFADFPQTYRDFFYWLPCNLSSFRWETAIHNNNIVNCDTFKNKHLIKFNIRTFLFSIYYEHYCLWKIVYYTPILIYYMNVNPLNYIIEP